MNKVRITINGQEVRVVAGSVLAVAIMQALGYTRHSVSGERRAPLCGMGVCQECRVTVNSQAQRLSCQTLCEADMQVVVN